jgi:hypothetical protein
MYMNLPLWFVGNKSLRDDHLPWKLFLTVGGQKLENVQLLLQYHSEGNNNICSTKRTRMSLLSSSGVGSVSGTGNVITELKTSKILWNVVIDELLQHRAELCSGRYERLYSTTLFL